MLSQHSGSESGGLVVGCEFWLRSLELRRQKLDFPTAHTRLKSRLEGIGTLRATGYLILIFINFGLNLFSAALKKQLPISVYVRISCNLT